MGTPEDTLTVAETAKMLGVTVSNVHALVRKGLIQPHHQPGKPLYHRLFKVEDVAALAEVRSRKIDMNSVATMAMQAYTLSRANERHINQLHRVLGFSTRTLATEQEPVVAHYLKMKELLERFGQVPYKPNELLDLSREAYAMDEAYLLLVEKYTLDPNPWEVFLTLLQQIAENAPRHLYGANKELENAYGYLEAARRHMRHVAYFYVRSKHGATIANNTFEMASDYASPIINLLFPH